MANVIEADRVVVAGGKAMESKSPTNIGHFWAEFRDLPDVGAYRSGNRICRIDHKVLDSNFCTSCHVCMRERFIGSQMDVPVFLCLRFSLMLSHQTLMLSGFGCQQDNKLKTGGRTLPVRFVAI